MPPVFPAGAGLRAQGQPVFPIGQAAAPGASDAPRFAPAALPNSAPATQVQDPNFNASGPPHMMSQPTQTQPVFPIGQAAAPGGPDAPRFAPAAFQSSATVMQAQAPNFNASGPPHMMQQPAQTQPVFPIGQAAVPAAFQSAPPMQPETTGSFANGPLQMPLQPQYMPSPAAGEWMSRKQVAGNRASSYASRCCSIAAWAAYTYCRHPGSMLQWPGSSSFWHAQLVCMSSRLFMGC